VSRILTLSAHDTQLDRRIIAELNTLTASGREITLVSVPTTLPSDCLDVRVRVVMPSVPHPVAGKWSPMKSLLRCVSQPFYNTLRSRWYGLGAGPVPTLRNFFLDTTPNETFDALHCHDLTTLPAAVALAERMSDVKIIYDAHELFPCQFDDSRIETYWSKIEAQYIGLADGTITVNDSIAHELADRYGIATPEVIYNSYGIASTAEPVGNEAFLNHFGAQPNGFKVLFQGGLDALRNLENLVLAFDGLRDHAQLFLLGDGPLEGVLRQLCDRHRISNVFLGRSIPQQDLLNFTKHADLGVIPYIGGSNLNTLYCTPNKLFEYIEAELPICASDLPELRKIVTTSCIGGVFEMETPDQIASALLQCRQRQVAGEFTQAALRAAREHYSWTRQAQRLLALYEKLGV